MSAQQHPTGPKDSMLGLIIFTEFQRNPLDFLTRAAHEHGDLIRFRFGPYMFHVLRHPDYIHEALVKQGKKLRKWPHQVRAWEKVMGSATFTSEGDFWRRQRRLLQPAFHTQRIKHYIDLISDHTQKMLDHWQDGQAYDMASEMSTVTMGMIAEILFDIKDIERDAADLSEALLVVFEMMTLETIALMPVPDWVPTPRNLRENRAMKLLNDTVMKLIHERRASGIDTGDVLSSLLLAVDQEESGGQMTDEQASDEIKALFGAGHETTSMMLTWTLYLLAQHPEIEAKLYDEVHATLNGRMPTLEDLEKMTYTDKVLRESMRVYPPAWSLIARETVEDMEIGGYTIPEGSVVMICPWVMHHDPRYWEDPQRFDPERFAGDWKKRIPTYAYFPFGGGEHICTGQHLAMMEAEILLAAMIERFTFEIVPGQNIEPQALITIRPKNGLYLKVKKRA